MIAKLTLRPRRPLATLATIATLAAWAVLALAGCGREAAETPSGTEQPAATAPAQKKPKRPKVKPVFFQIGFPTEKEGTFVIRLTDPDKIEAARAAIRDPENNPHSVLGVIVKKKARFNPDWSFHLKPRSVELFQQATEVCDATPQYVEEHLDEACGAFLPDCRWCPWSSKILAEIQPPGRGGP